MDHWCDSISKKSLCKTFPISKMLGVIEREKSLNQFSILDATQMLGIAWQKVIAQTVVSISFKKQKKLAQCGFERQLMTSELSQMMASWKKFWKMKIWAKRRIWIQWKCNWSSVWEHVVNSLATEGVFKGPLAYKSPLVSPECLICLIFLI